MMMGNSLWQLIVQSDAISKFVLLILLFMSIACWTVFFYKWAMLRLKRKHMQQALDRLKTVHNLDDMLAMTSHLHNTVAGYFLSRNLTLLKTFLEAQKLRGNTHVSREDWELVQQHMFQTIDDMVYSDESYVSLLSTSAAVSPLLGLFGTVWGLVHSFIRISEKQSADIATVAPGIAEALITTLAGLIVAIPALVMFNYLQIQLRALEQRYMILADRIGLLIQRILVK